MSASKSSLFSLLLYAGIAFATPPTPPATVRVDEAAFAQRAVLPVHIEVDGVVRQSRLQASVRPLPPGVAEFARHLLDAPNDDNGGNTFAGRDGYGDNNAHARIGLARMFRDTLWGRPAHSDVLSFWRALSAAVTEQQRELGHDILYFNYMPVPRRLEHCGCFAQRGPRSLIARRSRAR